MVCNLRGRSLLVAQGDHGIPLGSEFDSRKGRLLASEFLSQTEAETSMARLHRKELKHDEFVDTMDRVLLYVEEQHPF